MNDESSKKRTQDWEDEAPAESTRSRARGSAPVGGRPLPGATQNLEEDPCEARLRARRAAGRRWGWPRNRWLQGALSFVGLILLVAVILGGLWLKGHLYRDARFRIEGVRGVESDGLTEVSRTDLLPVFGEDIGRNIFFVPLGERRRQLEQIPWIEHATVMRLLPNRIRIAVVERKPVAFVLEGSKVALVDGDGVLLPMPAEALSQHRYSFPVVKGVEAKDLAPVRKGRMAVYQKLIAELDSGGRRYSEQISEVDLSNPEDVRIVPDKNSDVVADFGEESFLERFECYRKYIAGWRQLYPNLAEVDLRYKDRVYLRMGREGQEAPQVVESVPGASQPAPVAAPVAAAQSPKNPPAGAKGSPAPAGKSPVAASKSTVAAAGKPIAAAAAGQPKPVVAATKPLVSKSGSAAASTAGASRDTLVKTAGKKPVASEGKPAKGPNRPTTTPQKAKSLAGAASQKSMSAPATKPVQRTAAKAGKTSKTAAQSHAEAKHTVAAPAKPRTNPPPAWWQEQ